MSLKQMELLHKQINDSKEENLKIMESIKKEQKEKIEKYENEKIEKKKKKEMKTKEANNQLIKETNISKNFVLKECEEEFNNIKDIYCDKDINNLNITEELEDLFYNLYKEEKLKDMLLKKILEKIKLFKFNEQINCYNIQIIGNSGVGKSTLINTL